MPTTLDLKQIEQDWKSRGFSFGIWEDPPGQVWEDYVHDTDELFMVIEGKVELEMKGHKGCPAIGKEVLIPAKERHSVRNLNHSGPARWLYGYFQTDRRKS
jgi:cupin 2 domain-containing protein